MAAYATATDLANRYDERTIKEACSDDGSPHGSVTNDISAAALDAASGEVESALARGKQYTPEQLAALDGNAEAYLKALVCDIAMARLLMRRNAPLSDSVREQWKETREALKRLSGGEDLFAIDAKLNASLTEVDGLSSAEWDRLQTLPDRTHNYYPSRGSRLPTGR